jgi:hypothetical protein
LFYGFVENILHDQSTVAKAATATIHAVDLMGVVSRYEYVASSVPAEGPGARISRILTAIGVPAAWQSIATGNAEIAALEDGVYNGLAHCQDVVEADIGALYCTAAGVLTFEDRYKNLYRLGSAAVTTFSDTAAGAEVRILYGEMALTPPGRDYRNQVTVTGESGLPQTASDVPSSYPPDSLSRTVPLNSDSDALATAEVLLEVYRQTGVIWPEALSVSVWPLSQNALDEVSAIDLREFCIVEFTPAGKTQQTYKVFAESLDHNISDGHWVTSLGFSSADRWEDAWGAITDYLILDDATYGKLNTGKLGF